MVAYGLRDDDDRRNSDHSHRIGGHVIFPVETGIERGPGFSEGTGVVVDQELSPRLFPGARPAGPFDGPYGRRVFLDGLLGPGGLVRQE